MAEKKDSFSRARQSHATLLTWSQCRALKQARAQAGQLPSSRGNKTLEVQSPSGASDERPTTQEIATASAETARVPVTCASHTAVVSPHSCRLAGRRKIRFLHPRHRRQWHCRCCCLPGATSAVRHWVRGRCLASDVPRL